MKHTPILDGPRMGAISGTAKTLVILLHGYGADGNDLFGLAQPLSRVLPDTAFIVPNAPEPCAVSPSGYQWFPISWIDGSSEEAMRTGFFKAVDILNNFIDAELAALGLDETNLVLAGFSQGTMMSLHVGPRRATRLAGIVGFSGRLVEPELLLSEVKTRPPVLLTHGDADEVIPVASMEEAKIGLEAADIRVQTHVSPNIGHGIGPDALQLAAGFMKDVLK